MTETVSRNTTPSLLWSGHCLTPATGPGDREAAAAKSHERCQALVVTRHMCPCHCHLLPEDYECGCGYLIREAPCLGLDAEGDPQYVHVDEAGNTYSIECP